ncbi:hypothetical protein [Streptomyces sp. NPDC050564]|uniref:hypothetical protein n=1 Tax=Streptomyces sp. NPDC050564 TaxID=3365631 RepID=UPI00378C955E
MTDLIRRLVTWVSVLLNLREAHPARHTHPTPVLPTWPRVVVLPTNRSPYGLDIPLDGTATVAVRPYVTAHEQRERRRELALATLGLDTPGPYWIHGLEVA